MPQKKRRKLEPKAKDEYFDEFGRKLTRKEYLETQKKSPIDKNLNQDFETTNVDHNSGKSLEEILGFTSFSSSKNTKVSSNFKSAAKGAKHKIIKRQYRQYMNRPGGFNRPLAAVSDSTGKIKSEKRNHSSS